MLRAFHRMSFVPLLGVFLLASCGDGERAFPVRTYNMGEKVELGHINYQVFETQWLTHMGEGADARIPQQRFFLVRVAAINSGGSDLVVPTMTIQDDNGTVYNELSDGTGVPEWAGYLRSVKPALAARGNIIFDAPPRHYKLKITDESGERTAFIDIPLSFGAETPEIVTPGLGKEEKK
uniref:DUF4352 domain-containing protein n=1 Tax=Solibacter usitatus (strain Ellin6076) TaxID=234267 RepID=Q01YV5_SOLUE